jgi:hypothetical protein
MFNKAYKVAQFHYVEVQACKFDEGFKIAYADIGRRGFMFTLLGVTLWVRWNCDHPGASSLGACCGVTILRHET